jgi:hypothetical protein
MCYSAVASTILSNPSDLTARHTCATGLTTALPVRRECGTTDWNSLCRITIHYEQHIHPLWSVDRSAVNGTCTTCHAAVDRNADAVIDVPAGDLDLTDGASEDEPDHFRSYRELLFGDQGQIVENGAIVDECIARDPTTNVCIQFRQVPASMTAAGARASTRFFTELETDTGGVNHRGFMSPSELRLLAEWLDIGAQYYNDPFVAPEN